MRVEAVTEWAKHLAEGAALATQTQTQTKATPLFGTWDLLPNGPLVECCRSKPWAARLDSRITVFDTGGSAQWGATCPRQGSLLPPI